MFRILLFTALLITSLFVKAQEKKDFLEVDYQMEIVLDTEAILAKIPSQFRAQFESQVKQEIKNGIFVDYKLHSNGTESIYKMQEKINNNQSASGMIVSQVTATDKEPLYKNIKENFYLKPYTSFQNTLVKDSLIDFKWKISREKKNIAGYDALKATGTLSDSIQVTTWYTPKISIKDGPDRFWGLPGLILEAEFEMMDIKMIIRAQNIKVLEKPITIDQPKGGRILSQKQFEDEMKIFQKKMQEMYGGGIDSE